MTHEEQLWELLASAREQVQEIAHTAWTQAGKLNFSSGFASIKEMIPAPPKDMPLRVQLKFFRTQAQWLRRTADVISSELVSSQCAPQIQTCAHLPQRNHLQNYPFPQKNYRPDSSTAIYFQSQEQAARGLKQLGLM